MITSRDVAEVSVQTGFRSDVVEKVLRLHGILDRMDFTRQCVVPGF